MPVISEEQAQQYREALAAFEQHQAYQRGVARHAVYLAVKPIVESEAFETVQQQIAAHRATGPKDDSFFGIGIEALFQGMTSLSTQVANWIAPVAPVGDQPAPEEPTD